jgi:hypothetical protein
MGEDIGHVSFYPKLAKTGWWGSKSIIGKEVPLSRETRLMIGAEVSMDALEGRSARLLCLMYVEDVQMGSLALAHCNHCCCRQVLFQQDLLL